MSDMGDTGSMGGMSSSRGTHPAPTGVHRAASRLPRRLLHGAAAALALLVLLLVFAAYLQPAMAFQQAQQLWACF